MRRAPAALLLAAGLALAAPAGAEELIVFGWSEYVPQRVLDAFTRETGIEVSYESYASNEEMLAKLLSGASEYDLIQPSDYVVEALVAEGQLARLDASRIPNRRNLAPGCWGRPYDPKLEYSVPYMEGTVGIVIDTSRVKEPVTGYADLFQEKYRGRIVIPDDPREIVVWALATLGLGPDAVTAENLARVRPVIARWLPLVRVYDSENPKAALLGGDVWLGIVWSGEAALLMREAPGRFRYVLPKEGAHRFIDNLAIPKNAPHPEAAHRFIDYVLRPEVSREISKDFPYTNPNAEARKLLTPAELANEASYPPGDPPLAVLRDIGPIAVEVDRMVTALKAASGS